MMIPSSDSKSLQIMGLDTSQTIPIRAGHPTLTPVPITDSAILGATVEISNFPLQIQILLKKWVWIQVEPFRLVNVT
jgi:hypothetical protein